MAGERFRQSLKLLWFSKPTKNGIKFQMLRDGFKSPLKTFITVDQGAAIVLQNMNLTKLKKAS